MGPQELSISGPLKGYQITQARTPLARSGKVQIDERTVRITSLHLEEDSAKTTDV